VLLVLLLVAIDALGLLEATAFNTAAKNETDLLFSTLPITFNKS
jgi:hypothetical protein